MIRKIFNTADFNAPNRLRALDPSKSTLANQPTAIELLKKEPSTEEQLKNTPDLLQSLGGNGFQANLASPLGGQLSLPTNLPEADNQLASSAATQSGAGSVDPELRHGASGSKVLELQRLLEANGFSPGTPDGEFGNKTYQAVTAFQQSAGLDVDGVVGPNTWSALRADTNPTTILTPIEASRENVTNKRISYEAAQEHEREPDLNLAFNRYETALVEHLDALATRGESLDKAVSAAEEHEREPDLSNARERVSANNLEKINTQRTLTALRNETEVPASTQDIETSRTRVESARKGFELAQEHEREPDLTTARNNYTNALEDHIDVLNSRTPSLQRAVNEAQEHERQPDLRNAEGRLEDHNIEIRDTQITLSLINDGTQAASENRPLELDDRGPAVARLQDQLRQLGYDPGISDGWFGSNTLDALRAFQDDQIDALEATQSIADSQHEADIIDLQIQALSAEERAGIAGDITRQYLNNPLPNPLQADSAEFGGLFSEEYPEAAELLATGNYNNHFFRGVDLDLSQSEQSADAFNGDDNHIVVQSIFDPVVAHKPTTVDEYSVHINLPPGVDPQSVLLQLATDMDQFLGGDFKSQGDFKNQGEAPAIGQIIDIDVKENFSPFNAPVVISSIEDDKFSVQTIEYNNIEHLLHGTREWGFEEQADGSVKFYTRGISVEDTLAAEIGAKGGEKGFWTAWVDGIENYANTNGGSVIAGTRTINQTQGPSANQVWATLSPTQQAEIRESQVNGHQREADRLQSQFDTQVAEISDIRDIEDLDGGDRLLRAIDDGDIDDILSAIRRVIRDNEDSDDGDTKDAVESLEALNSSARSSNRLANEHRDEVEGWINR